MDHPDLTVSHFMENSIGLHGLIVLKIQERCSKICRAAIMMWALKFHIFVLIFMIFCHT